MFIRKQHESETTISVSDSEADCFIFISIYVDLIHTIIQNCLQN